MDFFRSVTNIKLTRLGTMLKYILSYEQVGKIPNFRNFNE